MKKRALAFEDSNHKNIAQYRNNYQRLSNRKYSTINQNELNRSLMLSDFIFVGDFHTFDHCLKNLLRILKLLISKKKKVVLALEMIGNNDYQLLNSFLSGHLTELEFLQSINQGNSWKFPWTHYRSIFEFVIANPEIEIIGVNTTGSLNDRDEFCADILAKRYQADHDKKFVVLYGEYHIAANKIPKILDRKLNQRAKITIVHQNLDTPYWKLIGHNKILTHKMVVKYNSNEFCLLTSPPWMKYESMCYWYENLYDDPEFDIHQYIIENGLKILSTNTIDNFEFICKQIISLFKISIKMEQLSFNIYDSSKIDYLKKFIANKYKNSIVRNFISSLIDTQHMLILPGSDKVYCGSYSSNKLAKLAGGILYTEIQRKNGTNFQQLITKLNKENHFIFFVLFHFHSYFMAKTINPYLKCDLYGDYLKLNKSTLISKSILMIFKLKTPNLKIVNKLKPIEVYEFARALGELLAESFFIDYQKKPNSFNVKKWRKNYLEMPITLESLNLLINDALKISGFKNLKKRYY